MNRLALLAPLLLLLLAPAAGAQSAPDSPHPAASKALSTPEVKWKRQRTARADLFFLEGSAAERVSAKTAADVDRAIADNLAWLGERTIPRLRLFFVGSRDQMKPFTGGTHRGWSVTSEGTAFFVANDSGGPALRHETMHLLSWNLWGTPAGQWLSEGLGTLAVRSCRGYTVDDVAAALRDAGELVPLDDLRRRFNVAGDTGVVYYYQSASLVQYINRRFGRKKLRQLWSTGGLARSRETLGIDVETLDRDWRRDLATKPRRDSWSEILAAVKASGCE